MKILAMKEWVVDPLAFLKHSCLMVPQSYVGRCRLTCTSSLFCLVFDARTYVMILIGVTQSVYVSSDPDFRHRGQI